MLQIHGVFKLVASNLVRLLQAGNFHMGSYSSLRTYILVKQTEHMIIKISKAGFLRGPDGHGPPKCLSQQRGNYKVSCPINPYSKFNSTNLLRTLPFLYFPVRAIYSQ